MQSGGFPSRPFGSLLKSGQSLMKTLLTSWAKSSLKPLGLTASALAADAKIH